MMYISLLKKNKKQIIKNNNKLQIMKMDKIKNKNKQKKKIFKMNLM